MDSTSQLTLTVKRILRELRTLKEAVSAGFFGVQKQISSIRHQQEAAHQQQKPPSEMSAIEFRVANEIERKNRAHREHQYALQKSIRNAAWAAFGAAAIYAGIAAFQLHQMKIATDAAKSAADTAKDALHISERAYITDGAVTMDAEKKSISMPILNSGHIPSGPVEVIIHEATVSTNIPATVIDLRGAGEHHWGRYNFQSIPLGWPLNIAIPAPQMSALYLNSGRQTIIIAGFITYNDGFPATPQQQWFFCQRTTYQTVMKQLLVGPCNPGDDTLHKLELIDGYPNNPEP